MRFQNNEFDDRIQERSKARMGKLKELMIFHMTSPNDAFRFFDMDRDQRLTF